MSVDRQQQRTKKGDALKETMSQIMPPTRTGSAKKARL